MRNKVFIIAEAGVNHNGSLSIAKRMVDAAYSAGADAVKFQTFTADNLVSKNAPKAAYQKKLTQKNETQWEMLRKLELSRQAHVTLSRYCVRKRIQFLSSPFDVESVYFLAQLGMKIFKIPSGEITNYPYLYAMGALKKSVILSTGMSTMNEIGGAIRTLTLAGTPKHKITILHCNTEYPTPPGDVNLKAMVSIHKRFNISVGYSDHTKGIEIPVAAAALGASVIEKHFTLSRKMKGPDHQTSLEPGELKDMVSAVRNIEQALGDGIKRVSPSERKNRDIVRKSIVAKSYIRKGETFTENNLTTKRPGTGISPMLWNHVRGKRAKRDFEKGRFITL